MKRKSIVTTVLVASLLLISACSTEMSSKPPKPPEKNKDEIKIVEVDKVARDPENYKGYIGIEGDVLKVYETDKKFLLSCGDSCVWLPVQFDGNLPKEKAKIIAYGEIETSRRRICLCGGKG